MLLPQKNIQRSPDKLKKDSAMVDNQVGLLMMYTRKKVLYNLIKELGNPSNVEIQKTMFLLTHCNYVCEKLYDFFPHRMGCYSIRLRSDYHSLADEDYLEEDYETNRYRIKKEDDYSTRITFFVDKEILAAIKSIVDLVRGFGERELIEYTYSIEPYYAMRSEILHNLNMDDEFFRCMDRERSGVNESAHALYTIGYEGRSIDGLLNELIKRNIRTLFDVRKNAFSMQREFSKQSLVEATAIAGIEYIHCSEVGIVSDKRQELLPNGRQDELFEWYKSNVLPTSRRFVDKALAAFERGSIALMCYEKDPMDCHRSRLADYCLAKDKSFSRVIHI